jgi:hypothetical protein
VCPCECLRYPYRRPPEPTRGGGAATHRGASQGATKRNTRNGAPTCWTGAPLAVLLLNPTPKGAAMATVPHAPSCATEQLSAVLYHPDLTPAARLAVMSALIEPELSQAERARVLGLARNTVRAALAAAERLGLLRNHVPPPAQPRATQVRNHVPGAQPRATPLAVVTALPGMEGQAQGRPPRPPTASTPEPEPTPQRTDVARDAVAEVRRLRVANGLATGANDRKVAEVLAELRAEGHQLDTVVAAAGRSLVLSVPSVVLTMNDGKVARAPRPQHPSFLSAATVARRGEDPSVW